MDLLPHRLPELGFKKDALLPIMSPETLDYHHGKHHKAYVDKLNQLIVGTAFEKASLEEIIHKATGPLFNNAGQIWNHNFFWKCLSPEKKAPSEALHKKIKEKFGSLEIFKEEFVKAAIGQFGSGWAWLVLNPDQTVNIVTTSNADSPLTKGLKPLLTIDVWEHAYYIDFRNDRSAFVSKVWDIINWDFVSENLN
jgi:Fe-Mn family superoxide dismutase